MARSLKAGMNLVPRGGILTNVVIDHLSMFLIVLHGIEGLSRGQMREMYDTV
jgi:hypothetical protein